MQALGPVLGPASVPQQRPVPAQGQAVPPEQARVPVPAWRPEQVQAAALPVRVPAPEWAW